MQFRSFVWEPMQYGRLYLAGAAAHTVPPTGAKGMNLAIADVWVSIGRWVSYYQSKSMDLLDAYIQSVLRRIWRAQHFSYWMTSMLHRFGEATDFDLRRQLAELEAVTSTRFSWQFRWTKKLYSAHAEATAAPDEGRSPLG